MSVLFICHELLQTVLNFHLTADGIQVMVSKSLDAHIRMDTKLAQILLTLDDEIDDLNREENVYHPVRYNAPESGVYKSGGANPFSISLSGTNRRLIYHHCRRCRVHSR